MQPIVIKNSRWPYLGGSILALALVIGGVVVLASEAMPLVGWMCIVCFGLNTLRCFYYFIDPGLRLVADEAGIYDPNLGIGVIPWHDIEEARIKATIQGVGYIGLTLWNREKYKARISWLARVMAWPIVILGRADIKFLIAPGGPRTKEIFRLIRRQCEALDMAATPGSP